MKSKNNCNAPNTATFDNNSSSGQREYTFFKFCTSYAVYPAKIKILIAEIPKLKDELFKNHIFINDVTEIEINPISKNVPKLVKSLFVV